MLLLAAAVSVSVPSNAHAVTIQILHTNDLHAALKTAGAPKKGEPEFGGWAQLKAKMDQLEHDALFPKEPTEEELKKDPTLKKKKPMETIRLDAGDYTEGSMDYFPEGGVNVLKAFQHMGYHATAMGNHDWLMGASDMDKLYGSSPFPFPVLSSNTSISRFLSNLSKQIQSSTQLIVGGKRIGIFGLSTTDSLYSWIPNVNSTKNSMKLKSYDGQYIPDDVYETSTYAPGIAGKMIKKLRQDNDVVIALTHLGYAADKALAAESVGLDLIIGGHSHTALKKEDYSPSRDGGKIPIVQAGFNGRYIGKIILEVEDGMKPFISSYELVEVPNDGPKDPVIVKDIEAAEAALKAQYGNRLDEVIGTSEGRLVSGDAGESAFSSFAVDSMKDITDADIAIDIGAFHGNTPQAAGPVTRQKLMEMYPRKFESDQNEGLYIYEADVPGFLLLMGLKYSIRFGTYISTSGVSFTPNMMTPDEFEKFKDGYSDPADRRALTAFYPTDVKIAGKPIEALHWYHIAGPESMIRGALQVSSLFKVVIRNAHPSSHTIWDAMNFHLLKIKNIPLFPHDHMNWERFFKVGGLVVDPRRTNPYDEGEGDIAPWIAKLGVPQAKMDRFISDELKVIPVNK